MFVAFWIKLCCELHPLNVTNKGAANPPIEATINAINESSEILDGDNCAEV
tara:strand:+ start:821 stop:973 length:153 start_codon:yes stop_codon:yes gene_type:complete